MARVLRLMVLGFIFSLIGFFSDVNSGALFGYYVQCPPILNLVFLVASAGFLSSSHQLYGGDNSDYASFIRVNFYLFSGGLISSSVLYGIQLITGGDFVFTALHVVMFVFGVVFGVSYITDRIYEERMDIFIIPTLLLSIAAGMSIYANVITLFIAEAVPSLVISGITLFVVEFFIKRNILIDFKAWLKIKIRNGFSNLREKIFVFGRWIVK